METAHKKTSLLTYLLYVVTAITTASAIYLFIERETLNNQVDEQVVSEQNLESTLANKETELADKEAMIADLKDEIKDLEDDLEDTEEDLKAEKNRNGDFEDQIEEIAGTVGVLDKLSKTDPELLAKYSKVYFLNENYRPARLSEIADSYVLSSRDNQFFQRDALPFLMEMLEEAKDDNIELKVASAFRSFESQQQLKGAYTTQYGSGANTFSADQGYSEHQLGTTVDLTTEAIAGLYTSFEDTPEFAWLEDNAYKYGFILSYPKDNSFYVYEPWHWRFVGTDLAKDINRSGTSFYEMDQRNINDYLVSLFD